MLEGFIGASAFQAGMQLYLKRHAYSNAKTEDLWAALGNASGQPIKDMMATWTRFPGTVHMRFPRTSKSPAPV